MFKFRSLVIFLAVSIIALPLSGARQNTIQKPTRSISAIQIPDDQINVDGALTETVWVTASFAGDFLQRNPNDGAPPSQDTRFAVSYDSQFLYVGIRAFDDTPGLINGILTRRDEISPSDWLYISVDSYHDHRTAFEFGLNAAGVKQDLRRFDDDNMDFDWDAVWEGAVNLDAQGWTAEFAIPFRELRFNTGDEMVWGLNVYREIPRNNNESSIWNYWSREETGFVSNYGELNGLKGIQAELPLYVSPFVLAQTGFTDENKSNMDTYETQGNIGADFKKSFARGLTLTGTINPDFGQVEADPADFNLTEFETYFRENRPFFMEGGNIFNFSLGFGDGDNSQNTLFYSRRIGRSPQGYAIYNNSDVSSVDTPVQARILGAGKLTGKLDNGFSIGLMSAVTAEEKAKVTYSDGSDSSNVIEPATNYLLTRIQQDFREGQTTIGGILTTTTRALDDAWLLEGVDHGGMDRLREKAVTGGLDFNHNFSDRKYQIESAMAFSHVTGSAEAITATQRHSSRYFQRPDAPHLELDSSRTSLDGYAGKFIFGLSEGKFNAAGGILATSPGFEVNDLGYMRSVDNINEFVWVGYRHWEPGKYFLNYGLNFNQGANWTFGGEMKNINGNMNGFGTLTNNWSVGAGINFGISGIVPFHLRGGPSIQGPDNYSIWANIGTDSRKKFSGFLNAFYAYNVDNVHSGNISPSVNWRPRKNISLSFGSDFNLLDDSWAWITTMADSNATPHYVFSGMDLAQTSLTFRADIILTNNLSFQYYTQAFLMGGDYHDYIEVDDHTARDFDEKFSQLPDNILSFDDDGALSGVDFEQDGIIDYWPTGRVDSNFNYRQLTSNMVLRWEYSAGSVAYFVWSRGASAADPFWNHDAVEDVRSMLDLNAENIFLLKVTKLLNI